MILYFKEWLHRLKSATPPFFKTLIRLSALLGTISLSLIALGDSVPTQVHDIAGYILAISTTVATIAASTKTDSNTGAIEQKK